MRVAKWAFLSLTDLAELLFFFFISYLHIVSNFWKRAERNVKQLLRNKAANGMCRIRKRLILWKKSLEEIPLYSGLANSAYHSLTHVVEFLTLFCNIRLNKNQTIKINKGQILNN